MMEDSQLNPNELSSRRVHLDLKVRNDYNNEKNLTPAHASEPSNENTPTQRSSWKTKIFSCNFCKKEFSTKQSLGGHQNAYKQERALYKRKNELVDVVQPFAPPNYHSYYYLYSNFNSHVPFHKSFTSQSSFGVKEVSNVFHNPIFYQAQQFFQMPIYTW